MKKTITLFWFLIFAGFINAQSWQEITQITPTPHLNNRYELFGYSVDIDGDYAVIGAPKHFQDQRGAAYVFHYNGSSWENIAILTASDGDTSDFFGSSVSISGDNVVVGASGNDDAGNGSGSAYVFTKPSGGWTDMNETAKLTASDADTSDSFGSSVSISGDNIVVGAYGDDENGSYTGSAYVFTKPSGGWNNTTETAKLIASDAQEKNYFGSSVGISGDNIVIGAYGDDENGSRSGSAYVFTRPSGGWSNTTEIAKLTASDGYTNDYFGYFVSISGDDIVVGAFRDDDGGSSSGSVYVFTKPSGDWIDTTETAKLTASDATTNDYFGFSVSISGDNIVVGTYGDDENGSYAGSAYVFTKPSGGWSNTTETAKLTASDAQEKDSFGRSVAVSGDKIMIGTYKNDNGIYSGAVYTYRKPSGDWENATESGKLLPVLYKNNNNTEFGKAIAIDGNYAVVGSSYMKDGCVYVLHYDGTSWKNIARLMMNSNLDSAIGFSFGSSVGISGNTIVVGAYHSGKDGRVFVFEKSTGEWTDMANPIVLKPSDSEDDDLFGYSVAISGDNIVVGAYQDDDNGANSGSAYVFTKPSGGWTDMTETAKLTASDGVDYDSFGYSVSISGDNIVVGAHQDHGAFSGSAYVFTKPSGGWVSMTETAKLMASDGAAFDRFGCSVGVSGDNIVVGAWLDDDGEANSGSAYVFTKPSGGWVDTTETAKLTASDAEESDILGRSVSISGDNIVAGAYGDGDNGLESGSAYVFTKPSGGWTDMTETAKLTASDAKKGDRFGIVVATSNANIMIGATGTNVDGMLSGSVYVFNDGTSSSVETVNNTTSSLVYPNPAHNQIIIENKEAFSGKIQILDITGKTVKQIIANKKLLQTIDINNLQSGIYFLRLQRNDTIETIKFIKQ